MSLTLLHILGKERGTQLLLVGDNESADVYLSPEVVQSNPELFGGSVGYAKYVIASNLKANGNEPGAVLDSTTLQATGKVIHYPAYPSLSGHGSERAGASGEKGFFGKAGDMLSNWFRDDETGDFSLTKGLMTALGLAALAWAATNMSWLFVAMLAFMVVGGAMLMGGGVSFANPHEDTALRTPPLSGQERARGEPARLNTPSLGGLVPPKLMLNATPIAHDGGEIESPSPPRVRAPMALDGSSVPTL